MSDKDGMYFELLELSHSLGMELDETRAIMTEVAKKDSGRNNGKSGIPGG